MSTKAKRAEKKKRELGRYVLDIDSMEAIEERDLGRYGKDFSSYEQLNKYARRLPEKRYTKVFDFAQKG
jgi:hypothetical protein